MSTISALLKLREAVDSSLPITDYFLTACVGTLFDCNSVGTECVRAAECALCHRRMLARCLRDNTGKLRVRSTEWVAL